MLVELKGIYKSFPNQDLFENLDLQIKENDKLAIVGANGIGKTTLFKIIQGEESYDQGSINRSKSLRMGFLNQIHLNDDELSVRAFLKEAYADLTQLRLQVEALEERMLTDHSSATLNQYAKVQEDFLRRGGYNIDHQVNTLLYQFGFTEADLDKSLKTFSGGQITRLAFVKLFLSKPDILFLDEPTNHLDIETVEWLESYLKAYDGAVVVVSHDRRFIDRVCNVVVEIEHKVATRYAGNYTQFQIEKKTRLARDERLLEQNRKEIARLEKQLEKFRSKASKASFVKSKEKYIERIRLDEKEKDSKKEFTAQFKSRLRGGNDVLITEDLAVGYNGVPLLEFDFKLTKGKRFAVIGENGTGKSTLLKTIAGKIPPVSGDFLLGHQIEMGYFDQQLLDFSLSNTVIEEVWHDFPDLDHTQIRQSLAQFLFFSEDIFKEIAVLSGGERVRLSLVKLMLAQDNFLVLDEPTNHLDLYGREALEQALLNYDGSMLFVSHDRYFVDKIATDLLIIKNGKVYHSEKELTQVLAEEKQEVKEEKKERNQSYKEIKRLQNRKQKLEEIIEELEVDLEAHRESRFEPEFYHDFEKMEVLNQTIDDIHNQIKRAEKEWLEIAEILEEK